MHGRQWGFNLVEAMVTIAVVAILVTVAIPSFVSTRERAQLRGATHSLAADLEWARSIAVRENQTVTVYMRSGGAWCYGIDTDGACDCNNAATCGLKAVSNAEFSAGLTLNPGTFPVAGGIRSVGFTGDGIPTQAGNTGFTLNGQNGTIALNAIGRLTVTLP